MSSFKMTAQTITCWLWPYNCSLSGVNKTSRGRLFVSVMLHCVWQYFSCILFHAQLQDFFFGIVSMIDNNFALCTTRTHNRPLHKLITLYVYNYLMMLHYSAVSAPEEALLLVLAWHRSHVLGPSKCLIALCSRVDWLNEAVEMKDEEARPYEGICSYTEEPPSAPGHVDPASFSPHAESVYVM